MGGLPRDVGSAETREGGLQERDKDRVFSAREDGDRKGILPLRNSQV